MSVFDWVSMPKLRLTASIERWVGPLANIAPNYALGNFSGRYLSYSKDGQVVEVRMRPIPIAASHGTAPSSNSSSFASQRPLAQGKIS